MDENTETVVEEPTTDGALTPEQEAANAALARADKAPASIGGPGVDPEPGELGPNPEAPTSTYATELARKRHELGDEVQAEGDPYMESRTAVLDGSADEADLETVQEWLLSDEAEVNTRKLRVRLGGPDDNPIIAPWFIRAIGIDVIRSAEREAAGANRAARRGQTAQYDELRANLRIVVEGTHTPDLKELAQQKGLRDPATLVERKFKYRPGVIAQIAGEIMALSGFDQEDVRAAGN
jgi:hypothetical protein